MPRPNNPRVFVSHANDDRAIVDHLIKLLLLSIGGIKREQVRFTSNATMGLSPGDWISQRLISDIRTSTSFIAVVSDSYLASRYCLWELGVRLGMPESTVIGVFLPGVDPGHLGDVFADMHLLSLMTEESVQQVVKEVAKASLDWELQLDLDDLKKFCEDAKSHPPNPIERWRKSLVRLVGGQVFLNAYGLGPHPVKRNLFQNFHPERANVQPVQYMWADPRRGNAIRAQLIRAADPGASFLRVWFQHLPNSWGCNFAIRPLNREAVMTGGANSIVITARVGEESGCDEIGVKLRIVNGYMQHWENSSAQVLRIHGDQFAEFALDLDPACWAIFTSDGTGDSGPTVPDFSIVASLVLGLGGYEDLSPAPTPGNGVLDLCSIGIR
jgi:hypothetical protein